MRALYAFNMSKQRNDGDRISGSENSIKKLSHLLKILSTLIWQELKIHKEKRESEINWKNQVQLN